MLNKNAYSTIDLGARRSAQMGIRLNKNAYSTIDLGARRSAQMGIRLNKNAYSTIDLSARRSAQMGIRLKEKRFQLLILSPPKRTWSINMDKKLLFIYNPKAGKAQIRTKLADILNVFAGEGYELTVFPTQKRGDARKVVAERSEDYSLVVCSGGDGTLDETVTGMIQSGFCTPIGYIPAGSTNDFGGSLGLPKNMVKAAQTIVEGKNFPCDMGAFNEDVFVYIAAFGLFTDVSYETGQDMKNVLGHMAYVLEGMKRLPAIKSYPMRVAYEDKVITDDFIFGMVTNSVSVGGFKNITGKNVKLDDGVFEVTLIKKPKNPVELNNIILSLLNRDIDTKSMYCFRTAELELESAEPLPWTLDGENGGTHKNVRIKNLCKAIEIRVK